jgi:hypothetical protein
MSISLKEAEALVEEIAFASDVDEEEIVSLRKRIPSDNKNITPLLWEVASVYFLTDEVLEYYINKLHQLASK